MKGLALVIGAGGIGTQLAKDLNESEKGLDVVLCGRKSEFNLMNAIQAITILYKLNFSLKDLS